MSSTNTIVASKKAISLLVAMASLSAGAAAASAVYADQANGNTNANVDANTNANANTNDKKDDQKVTEDVNFIESKFGTKVDVTANGGTADSSSNLQTPGKEWKPGTVKYTWSYDLGQVRQIKNGAITFAHPSKGSVTVTLANGTTQKLEFTEYSTTWVLVAGGSSSDANANLANWKNVNVQVDDTAEKDAQGNYVTLADPKTAAVQNVTLNGPVEIPTKFDVITKNEDGTKGDLRQGLKLSKQDSTTYEGFGVDLEKGVADLHVGETKSFYYKPLNGDAASKPTLSFDKKYVDVKISDAPVSDGSEFDGYYEVTVKLVAPIGSEYGEEGGTLITIGSNLSDNEKTKTNILVRGYYYATFVDFWQGNDGFTMSVNDKALLPTYRVYGLDINKEQTSTGVLQLGKWSSNNPNVVSVDEATGHLVTGATEGNADITVSANDTADGKPVTDRVNVKVVHNTPTNVEVTAPDTYDATKGIKVGETVKLTAKVTPETASSDVTWQSSDEKVATVAEDGTVTGVSAGKVTIQAKSKDGGVVGSFEVTVYSDVPTAVTATADKTTLKAGETAKVTAKVTPDEATQTVKWSSSDEKVATVAEDGTVTAVAAGKVTITATTVDNGADGKPLTATVDLTVTGATADAFKGLGFTYNGKDIEGFTPDADSTYPLDKDADFNLLKAQVPDGLTSKVEYLDADGKTTDDLAKAVTAKYTVTAPGAAADGTDVTHTYTFTKDSNPVTNTVKVTLVNGNGKPDTVQEFKTGQTIKITSPVWGSRKFLGWSTEKGGKTYVDAEGYTVPDKDVTLYAVWDATGIDTNVTYETFDDLLAKADQLNAKGQKASGATDEQWKAFQDAYGAAKSLDRTAAGVDDVRSVYEALEKAYSDITGDDGSGNVDGNTNTNGTDGNTNTNGTDNKTNAATVTPVKNNTGSTGTGSTGTTNSSRTPAQTGAVVSVFGLVTAATAGLGTMIRKRFDK